MNRYKVKFKQNTMSDMKFIFKMILTVVLMFSSAVILAMTSMTTATIWDGDFSAPNIMMFIGGLIGASSLIIHAMAFSFNKNQQDNDKKCKRISKGMPKR